MGADLRKEVGQLKERLFEKDESQSKPKESNNRDEQHLAILKTKFTVSLNLSNLPPD